MGNSVRYGMQGIQSLLPHGVIIWPSTQQITTLPTSAEVKKTWIYTSTPHTPSWRSA
jgi:hypothetical protein